jgi:hypothetical protein
MAIRVRTAQALAVMMAVTAPAALAATPAADLVYERALMKAADSACRLFAPDVSTALTASLAQARGAALRSGVDAASLAGVEARAQASASAAGCASPDIAIAAQRVRAAFEGYAHLDRMEFPGQSAGWLAERPVSTAQARWRVTQHDRFGWDEMTFGVVGHGADRPLMAVAMFADGAQPYAARLIVRDATLTSGPFLDVRAADIAGRIPLDGRLPPRSATRAFPAEAMSLAGHDLKPAGAGEAWAFRFPAAASEALAGLDPRESVAVEFLFAGDNGEDVRTAYVEVGDFAAARAFQSLDQR